MSFGKANQPQRRRRERAQENEEVDEQAEREEKLNTQMIPIVASIVGTFAMLGIALMAAPYSYGSKLVRYSSWHIEEAARLKDLGKAERAAADKNVLIDFTTIIVPKNDQASPAMNAIAAKCQPSNAKWLKAVTPDKVEKAYRQASAYLTCAMGTDRQRLCDPAERQMLVNQLMEYKERRQNVLAMEVHRDKEVIVHEQYRDMMREQGGQIPPPLPAPPPKMAEGLDPNVSQQLSYLVRMGYIGAYDFGYFGFYVPREYKAELAAGAERYAQCPA